MSSSPQVGRENGSLSGLAQQPTDRRSFVKWTGVSAAALFAAACDDTEVRTITEVTPPDTVVVTDTVAPPRPASVTIDLSNDIGVLNFAYALEQLEAAFYQQVVTSPDFASTFAAPEQRILTDLRDHEVIHREFYEAAIPALGGTLIGSLTPDFSAVDFSSRTSVLTTARQFEDLGVYAYNGAGQFLSNPTLLTVAGKIVSVEARHAAAIRDLLSPEHGNFAPSAFDEALPPPAVAAAAQPFIRNLVRLTNVPTFTPSAYRGRA